MKTLEKILAEIADLQEQGACISDKIAGLSEYYGLACKNCRKKEQYWMCSDSEWPLCFVPNEEWREKYKKKAVEDSV